MDLFEHIFKQSSETVQTVPKLKQSSPESSLKQTQEKPFLDRKIERHLSSINYEADKREAMIKEKKKAIPLIEFMDANRATEHIEKEISNTMAKKKWKGLDTCFKWKLIEQYLEFNAFKLKKSEIDVLKNAVRKNLLTNVSYDNVNMQIAQLNFTVGDIIL